MCVSMVCLRDLRFIQCPAGQGAAERDQGLFDDLAAQFLPSRFFVEVYVVVEGGGWRGGVEVAGDGHCGGFDRRLVELWRSWFVRGLDSFVVVD